MSEENLDQLYQELFAKETNIRVSALNSLIDLAYKNHEYSEVIENKLISIKEKWAEEHLFSKLEYILNNFEENDDLAITIMEVLAYIADDEKKLKLIEELERYLKIATLFDIKDRMYLIEWLQGYLGRLKGKTIVQALISALERMNEDNDPTYAHPFIEVLVRKGGNKAVEILMKILENGYMYPVHSLAIDALGYLKHPKIVGFLIEILKVVAPKRGEYDYKQIYGKCVQALIDVEDKKKIEKLKKAEEEKNEKNFIETIEKIIREVRRK
ncbi:MAG: HEAT repeat domain-containing protein [Candidatus Heimdallarchaeaceae archaeon]